MSEQSHFDERAFLHNWIDGGPVPAQDGTWLEKINPATGEHLREVARSKAADVDAAVQAAKAAGRGAWRVSTLDERAALCHAIADAIEDNLEELAWLESGETGKPISVARRIDIPRAVANFRFFASVAKHESGDFHPMAEAINYTLRRPIGVVGLITPWNLPLYLLSWKAAPALVMGNTIVAKPSEITPGTATFLAELTAKVGLPKGVFNLVHGLGPEVGQSLITHPDVKAVSFTGGTATGAIVAQHAAPSFKKLSLELGGKNPTVVFADCDFEKAVQGTLRAAFTNQGQICLCGSRILVERSICDRFVEALVEATKKLQIGHPWDETTTFGALTSHAHRDKIEAYLALAVEEGGTIVCGGQRPVLSPALNKGAYLEPTLITGLSSSCRTVQEEIFGPVATIQSFDGEDEALSLANDVRYGLSASVWTTDLTRAHRMGAALEAGMVWVNTWLMRDLRTPFGGTKESGVGREGGRYSLDFFSESRNVCIYLGTSGGAIP